MPYFHRLLVVALNFFVLTSACFSQLTASRDGKVDLAFGDNGIRTVSIAQNLDLASVLDMEIAPDGKIVVLGFFIQPSGWMSGLYRFLPNGDVDISFGNNGFVLLETLPWHVGFAVKVREDGKILLAGYKDLRTGSRTLDMMLLRLNVDGSLDTSFGDQGIFLRDFTAGGVNAADALYSLTLRPDGRIVVAGTSDRLSPKVGSDRSLLVMRLTADGALDSSFGENGVFITSSGKAKSEVFGSLTSLALQADGKILSGVSYGIYVNGPQSLPTQYSDIVRINPDGTLDNSFSDDGRLELGQGFENFQEIYVHPDGKLTALSGYGRISQIDAQGRLDTSFGTGGQIVAGSILWRDIAIDGEGKIIATDYDSVGTVRRFLANGGPDIKFGRTGTALTNRGLNNTFTSQVKITNSGDLIFAGLAGQNQKQLVLTKHFGKRKL